MMYVSARSPMLHRGYMRGLGDPLSTAQTAQSIAATGLTITTSILAQLGLVSAVVPVVGAAIAAIVGIAIVVETMFRGCGQTCVAATNIANQADAIMTKNVNTYTSIPVRYASMQAAALNNFDTTWAALQKACAQAALGAAGQRCITDRQQGACTWKASQGGWNSDGTFTPWGAAGSGTVCWNWFVGMRDPIANDPFVQPDPTPSTTGAGAGSSSQSITSTISRIPTPLLIGGGLLAVALLVKD